MSVAVSLDRRAVQVSWDASLSPHKSVVLRATNPVTGDVSNTSKLPNDGNGVLTFPAEWSGSTFVEVLDEADKVFDSGDISV